MSSGDDFSSKRIFSLMRKVDVVLSRIENWVSTSCFVLMSIFVIVGIVLRYVLQIPNRFGEEASRYLMICGIFFGISVGVRKKAHLGIQIFVEKMPARASKIIKLIASLVTVFAYFSFTYLAFLFVMHTHRFGQTSPAMNIPMYVVYSTLLAGLGLSFIRSIMVFFNDYFFVNKILNEE